MKIQSPAILAIGLVVSLVSAIAGSVAPNGTAGAADKVSRQASPVVESRRAGAIDAALPLATHLRLTEVEPLASDH